MMTHEELMDELSHISDTVKNMIAKKATFDELRLMEDYNHWLIDYPKRNDKKKYSFKEAIDNLFKKYETV